MNKLNKNKKILILAILIIGISLLVIGIVLSNKGKTETLSESNNDKPASGELLGEERIQVQDEISEVIEKYISNNKDKIKDYLEEKDEKKLTIKEMKDNLKIDISEFEKLKYGCSTEFTTIDFNDDYSEHVLSLTCDSLLSKES